MEIEEIRKKDIKSNGIEKMAVAESADADYFAALLPKEIFRLKIFRAFCKTDKKLLEEHLKSSKVIEDLRLRVDVARLQEMAKLGKIAVHWVDNTHQLPDSFTKNKMK